MKAIHWTVLISLNTIWTLAVMFDQIPNRGSILLVTLFLLALTALAGLVAFLTAITGR
jgi:ABC-type Na+ efflux pump permease subunit